MGSGITRRSLAIFIAAPIVLRAFPALAEDVAPEMTGLPRLAIGGYDTVTYHSIGKAVPGRLEYQTIWHNARWQFSSQENLDLFAKDPRNMRPNMTDIARWVLRMGTAIRTRLTPRLSPS